MDDTSIIRAFALGYYHGRADGVYNCPFEQDEYKASYRDGYDAGVADYCVELDEEEAQ
jgi:hypothetical protein